MLKYFLIFLLLVAGGFGSLNAEPSESKIESLVVNPRLKFYVYQFDPNMESCGDVIKQVSGTLKIPDGKYVVVSLDGLNKTNINSYISVVNRITVLKEDAYIAIPDSALELLSELGKKCPAIKNLRIVIFVDKKKMLNLSTFKKLSRLGVLIALRKRRKIKKDKELLLYSITQKEQDYVNEIISYVGKIKSIKELLIVGHRYDINLSTYNKQQHIESLTIDAGKLTLPDNLGTVKTLIISCLAMVDFPEKLKSFKNLSKLTFGFSSASVLSLPKLIKLEYLDLSWNDFSYIKFNDMPMLKTLKLGHCRKLSTLFNLTKIKNLKTLELNAPSFKNTDALENLHNLKTLNLSGCKKINSLDFLSKMPLLQNLNVAGCNISNRSVDF